MDNRISDAIQDVMAETTFTEGALQKFKDALEQVKTLESDLESDRQELRDALKHTYGLEQDNKAQAKTIQTLKAREREMEKREDLCHAKEVDNAAHKARAEAIKECFGMVFGNPTVHRSIHGQVPVREGGDNGYSVQQNYTKDESVTEAITAGWGESG